MRYYGANAIGTGWQLPLPPVPSLGYPLRGRPGLMFGIVGDDLAIVLFLVSLAATFAVAGLSQAGWKHWAFIALLFGLAVCFLLAGVGWPWLKALSPEFHKLATRVVENPISWFVVIMLGLSGVLLINKTNKESRPEKPGKIRTGITLEFVSGQTSALASKVQNIWRWYSLIQTTRQLDQAGNLVSEHSTVTIFLSFDRPVNVRQMIVTSEGGLTLPAHEVKDWSIRHAIILFIDDPAGCIVGIRAAT